MPALLDYISEEKLLRIGARKREEILRTLIDGTLKDEDAQPLREAVFREITTRSRKKEIYLGNGFGLSHARVDAEGPIHVGIGLFGEMVKYRLSDPIHTLLCLVVPDSKSRVYLSLMARLSRMLAGPDASAVFRDGDNQAIMAFIEGFDA